MNACIILARTDSKRLPNKATTFFGSKRLVEWCIDALKQLPNVSPILATSDRSIDEPLIEIAKENNISYFQGDALNVANRVAQCLKHFEIENFARINGDSPFIRADLLQKGFEKIQKADFVTNLIPRTFPYGVSVEIFKSPIFLTHVPSFTSSQQEHISSYFYENINNFHPAYLVNHSKNYQNVRLTVDSTEDATLFKKMLSMDESIMTRTLEKIVEIYNLATQKKES